MISAENNPTFYLLEALTLADKHRGFCAPNPAVGAVIVKAGTIIATGYHQGPGTAHAEIDALNKLANKEDVAGSIMYVTLEPCCHHGRTPPCTNALIDSGIQYVVYAYRDPNPLVAGKGHAALLAAGVKVDCISVDSINRFYQSYQHWHLTQKPYLTAKIALSLDGKIAQQSGAPIAITGSELKALTHAYRKKADAILTTAKTIISDDPQLNVRLADEVIAKDLYILDTRLSLPLTAAIYKTARSLTVFHASDACTTKQAALLVQGVRCIPTLSTIDGLVLLDVIHQMGADGKHDVWIEAGGHCFSAFMKNQLLQRALLYIAPRWMGEGKVAFNNYFNFLSDPSYLEWRQVGQDVLCEMRW